MSGNVNGDDDFNEDYSDLIDEDAVRNLLKSFGFENPSREAIHQTMIETQKAFREQQQLEREEGLGTEAEHHRQRPADAYPHQSGVYMREEKVYAPDEDEGLRYAPEDSSDGPRREEHVWDDRYPRRGNNLNDPDESLTAHTTASTPAGATGRTPTSNPRRKAQRKNLHHPPAKNTVELGNVLIGGGGEKVGDAQMMVPSVTSSTRSSHLPTEPYHKRSKEPLHLQHFAPYLKMVEEEQKYAQTPTAINKQPYTANDAVHNIPTGPNLPARPGSAHPATARASIEPAARVASTSMRPKSAASMQRSNVIYSMTGDKHYRPNVLTPRGATARVAVKHSDPVSRGAHMRQLWQHDGFLSQKGRKEERWQVRRSMLSWEGQ